jgi:hypothetical protein
MTNKKGRAGWHQQTALNTAFSRHYFTRLTSLLKGLVLMLAVWGWVPLALADWLQGLGGQHDE